MQICPKKLVATYILLLGFALTGFAQDGPKTATLEELKNATPPTTAEVMRGRIEAAKANLVVKNYAAAIYDLENIRRETNEPTVNRVLNVLLMHAYLEQGEYKKAQNFLKELRKEPFRNEDYFAVAGQVVKGARTQIARYVSLGVSTSGVSLPKTAQDDLDSMRETLELVISQSREIGKKKELASMASVVVEESSSARSSLARDDYDKKRWNDQVAEAREQMVNPQTRIISAMASPIIEEKVTLVAQQIKEEPTESIDSVTNSEAASLDQKPLETSGPTLKPVVDTEVPVTKTAAKKIDPVAKSTVPEPETVKTEKPAGQPSDRKVRIITSAEKKPTDDVVADKKQPDVKSTDQVAENAKPVEKKEPDASETDGSPMTIGSLIGYATKRVNPVYPRQARTMRMTGVVKVEVIIDEDGRVSEVESTVGPSLLKRAAQDAVRKWQFTPFERDGQPVKASGFVSFNFNL
jgi:TonB family protein